MVAVHKLAIPLHEQAEKIARVILYVGQMAGAAQDAQYGEAAPSKLPIPWMLKCIKLS